ncbi:hypothetical protein LIA77_00198 [Sarocladium implicatum]|nr:hypothetical protein LIA77_00198 [Sarocladium implicatum]
MQICHGSTSWHFSFVFACFSCIPYRAYSRVLGIAQGLHMDGSIYHIQSGIAAMTLHWETRERRQEEDTCCAPTQEAASKRVEKHCDMSRSLRIDVFIPHLDWQP